MTKHDNADFRQIAEHGLILRGQVGSGLHGVATGADDRDDMGVCIEGPEWVLGLQKMPFEQYEYRTQPDGNRSGAGDLDLVVYSLRKWARLAADGNPTILLLLFIPEQELVYRNDIGRELQDSASMFLSRQVAARFAGYLTSQKEKMLGIRAQRTNRPELIEAYGFDSKFAYHMVRLGIQGVELLTTGRITLPIVEPDRTWLTDLRHGRHTKEEALDRADAAVAELARLAARADLPEYPDRRLINRRLLDWYGRSWRAPLSDTVLQ
jgi:hypothetical protein